ncbi:NAD(P)-dependent oxidoreductase [Kovacikia minuta CCNUW1]|uniref:NAD-dependent epimerase/dehydratase family protein n=1 Tax=Kovacikia minuta TaxID=2931930 RepID=UPI001CCCD3AD|nr:NAD(P)-dependent oxidoreductase [Kovacikia minuta]UBF26807.1 NAD(P)-dependent oxidoreductase [Kovacikia minuta CCNUW1]
MTSKRIFVTGASGCIGHYVVEALIQETNHELYLLLRNPDKLKVDYKARPGITILQGDIREIERFSSLLKTMDSVILIATSWGGPAEVYDVNVVKTIDLINLLDLEKCQQVIYFSTASILDRNNCLLKEAGEIGTDYIRSKYMCFRQLAKLAIAPRITTLFPTLLLGGDSNKPQSHASSGIPQIERQLGLLRFFQVDGSFHFIHGKDIAQIVRYLIDHPPAEGESRELVLGNQRTTVNQAIEESCTYLNKRIYFRIPLTPKLADIFIKLFRIRMAPWDRFSMGYRHFTHQRVVTPATFGLPIYCATFTDVLKISGVGRKR